MVRRGKLKYKDVVKKVGGKQSKKHPKKPKQRKTYSLYKNEMKRKLPKSIEHSDKLPEKKIKVDEVVEHHYESSSEEETNELSNLINTFSNYTKATVAIESSSESDDEEQSLNNEGTNLDQCNPGKSEPEESIFSENESELVEEKLDDSETYIKNNDNESHETEEIEFDLETHDEDNTEHSEDPFAKHLFFDIHDSLFEALQHSPINVITHNENWPQIGNLIIQIPKGEQNISNNFSNFGVLEKKTFAQEGTIPKKITKSKTPEELFMKPQIIPNIIQANTASISDTFSPLQAELFSIINNYQDLYFPYSTFSKLEEIRFIYCLHAVNHVLKTRLKVIHHNAKLSLKDEVPDAFRDQGLVRPKVLILLPFKDSAYKVVMLLIKLILSEDKGNVMNKIRFLEDYTGNELILPKKNPKPEDYEQIFQGNTSDDFKIGITVTKKSLKLYADFYSSDIILASPLGLRTIIGAEGEAERDYDFLASIELLILDQTELFLMQNWDHVIHMFNHLHLQPKDSHGTDFSRVRSWSLNGWAKYYRQTLIFSSLMLPEINSIFNKRCYNYAGKVKVVNPIEVGCIGQVVVQIPHVFQRFDTQHASDAIDARFDFFVSKILPQQKESLMKQTMIFIPSYFDYVRLRNYFKKEDIGFVQICEYSKDAKVARARDMFFHGDAHFLLYTERFHFFNRKRIKGIRHLVFYQPPTFPHFYYEMCNYMQEAYQNRKVGSNSNMSVTVIYSKYDIHQLSNIVGSEKAARMCQSDRKVHMMITGND